MLEQDTIAAKIGSLAPDFTLPTYDGREITLSSFRGKSNVILFFVREYTCMQCRSHVTQLGRLYAHFKEVGSEVLVIIGSNAAKAADYARITNAPFPILVDEQRVVYAAYELEKYFSLFQRTASIVVDKQGIVRYLKRTTVPNVWLQESRELLGFVDSLNEAPFA